MRVLELLPLPWLNGIATTHNPLLILSCEKNLAAKGHSSVKAGGVVVWVGNSNSVYPTKVLYVLASSVVNVRDAIPQDITLLRAEQKSSLPNSYLRLRDYADYTE